MAGAGLWAGPFARLDLRAGSGWGGGMKHPIVKLLAVHCLAGFVMAGLFVAGVVINDFGHLRTLAMKSSGGWAAIVLLTFFCGLTFASVQMGVAIMMQARREGDSGGRRAPPRNGSMAPAMVRARVLPTRR